jgi:hypothetical protein
MTSQRVSLFAGLVAIGSSVFVLGAEVQKTQLPALSKVGGVPLTLLEIMRASVEIPADGIWSAQSEEKLSDEQWQLADQDSINLIVGSSLVARGGTGKSDAKWVGNVDYQSWAKDLLKTSLEIRAAVKAKDFAGLGKAADHLQEICEGCHTKYRPQTPSDGLVRYPFYPKRELAK